MASPSALEQYIVWKTEPGERGTLSILSSCVSTLILCVYTAIHINVPAASQSQWQRRRVLAGWVCAGIFAPEIVVWAAWCQLSEARNLTSELPKLAKYYDSAGPRGIEAINDLIDSWTLQHSFFVVMGGYQLHPKVAKDNHLCEGRKLPKSILDAQSFLLLLKAGHVDKFPLLAVQDIADRSKADNFAKVLSCVQGLWLVIQLAGRKHGHLSISELEVNTLAHVICAIAMYACWMKKPLNIQQPVWVEGTGLEAWMYLHANREGHGEKFNLPAPTPEVKHNMAALNGLIKEIDKPNFLDKVRGNWHHRSISGPPAEKWEMHSCPHMIPPSAFNSVQRLSSMVVVSSCYGGLHAALWNYHFPTMTEAWLWRVSALVVAGNGLVVFLICTTAWAIHWCKTDRVKRWLCGVDIYAKWMSGVTWTLRQMIPVQFDANHRDSLFGDVIGIGIVFVLPLIVFIIQLIFLFCRMFLFVEAFISLRSQPASVYETPKWSQWMPHVS